MSIGVAALLAQDRRAISVGPPPAGPYSPAIAVDGLVYVSGMLGAAPEATDVRAQARRIFEQMGLTLQAAGSSLAQVVNVQVYLKRAEDAAAFDEVYRTVFATAPPARTVVVTGLPNEALVEVSAIAAAKGTARQVLLPAGWAPPAQPFSYGIRAGDQVFLSALTAFRPGKAAPAETGIGGEVKSILDDAQALLASAGLDLTKAVASRVYIKDVATFAAMNTAYGPFFPTNPPVRATAVASSSDARAALTISLTATAGTKQMVGGDVTGRVLSPAIRVGRHVFVSGMLGNTAENATDVAAQTRETLARIAKTLAGADMTFADVVDSTVFLTDLANFAAMNTVYREFFPTAPPARATIGTGLVVGTGLVEIMVTGVK